MNEVKITGKVYNPKVTTTMTGKNITRFGLSIYCGKDKEGKSKYGFVDCKYFGSWEKDGKKFSKPEIIVDTIVNSEMFAPKKEEKIESDIDDSIDDLSFN